MASALMFISRIIVGLIAVLAVWFVLDTIHDRNTEIIVSSIGLLYSFIFIISRRMQYFGLTVFSTFGRASSFIQKVPYDQLLSEEAGVPVLARHLYLNFVFASIIELLCLYRLFTSLLGRGWGLLSDPIHNLLLSAQF